MKKILSDFLPLLLFFIALKIYDIYVATGVAIAASIALILYLYYTQKPVETIHWINLIIIVVFGGATILLHDETFIKWKPTVLTWCFASILLIGLLFKRNFLKTLMSKQISMPEQAWTKMTVGWILFFALVGIANLYVAFWGGFTTDQWASFKVFGITVLTLVFAVGQSLWLGKHMTVISEENKNHDS
ncbi:septation protein A [Taylorella equigenitalis]|uniref:septation protein A n=1 Tax=Taylorella equigenitalis TaxID=29575 RepID=UPI000419098C|nr:septation protein A [Taylorella equigenitalis]WDU48289.1 septation protein A [Taylorella equigenitalis]